MITYDNVRVLVWNVSREKTMSEFLSSQTSVDPLDGWPRPWVIEVMDMGSKFLALIAKTPGKFCGCTQGANTREV